MDKYQSLKYLHQIGLTDIFHGQMQTTHNAESSLP